MRRALRKRLKEEGPHANAHGYNKGAATTSDRMLTRAATDGRCYEYVARLRGGAFEDGFFAFAVKLARVEFVVVAATLK